MPVSLVDAFYVEQAGLATISLGFFAIFAAQIHAERLQGKLAKANIRFSLHRVGLLVSLMLCVLSVDPFGIHGLLAPEVTYWIAAEISAFLLFGLIFIHDTVTRIAIRSRTMRMDSPEVTVLTWALVLLTFVICNASYAVAVSKEKWWYTAFFIFWVAALMVIVSGSYFIQTVGIIDQWSKADESLKLSRQGSMDSSSGDLSSERGLHREPSESELRRANQKNTVKVKAYAVVAIAVLLVPPLIYAGVARVDDLETTVPQPDLESFDVSARVYLYAHILCVLVVLWYSWIPMTNRAYHAMRSQSFSDLRSTSGNQRKRSFSHRRSARTDSGSMGESGYTTWKEATAERLDSQAVPKLDIKILKSSAQAPSVLDGPSLDDD